MQTIFIHGLGQNASSWDETISYLPKDNEYICLDLFSLVKGEEITYDHLYQKLEIQLNEIPGKLRLCGLSLGGVMTIHYAIKHPEKVDSLIVVAGQYKMPKQLLKLQNIIFRFIPESKFNDMGIKKKDFIGLTKSMMTIDFTQELEKISCPTLILCGEKDTPNKKAAKTLVTMIKGAELRFIQSAKHEVNTDKPKELAACINNFYK
ncbi:MAG: alpha/beta fold hydrolase [Cellulosilyticaceae bacterium]